MSNPLADVLMRYYHSPTERKFRQGGNSYCLIYLNMNNRYINPASELLNIKHTLKPVSITITTGRNCNTESYNMVAIVQYAERVRVHIRSCKYFILNNVIPYTLINLDNELYGNIIHYCRVQIYNNGVTRLNHQPLLEGESIPMYVRESNSIQVNDRSTSEYECKSGTSRLNQDNVELVNFATIDISQMTFNVSMNLNVSGPTNSNQVMSHPSSHGSSNDNLIGDASSELKSIKISKTRHTPSIVPNFPNDIVRIKKAKSAWNRDMTPRYNFHLGLINIRISEKHTILYGRKDLGKTSLAKFYLNHKCLVVEDLRTDLKKLDPSIHTGIIFENIDFRNHAAVDILTLLCTTNRSYRYDGIRVDIPNNMQLIFTTNIEDGKIFDVTLLKVYRSCQRIHFDLPTYYEESDSDDDCLEIVTRASDYIKL